MPDDIASYDDSHCYPPNRPMTGLPDLLEDAGAPSEQATERDGAFSYHAETHSAGVGAGIAWFAIVTGDLALLSLILPAITAGLHAKDKNFGKILTDVRQEPHYALGGALVGALLGIIVRYSLRIV